MDGRTVFVHLYRMHTTTGRLGELEESRGTECAREGMRMVKIAFLRVTYEDVFEFSQASREYSSTVPICVHSIFDMRGKETRFTSLHMVQ